MIKIIIWIIYIHIVNYNFQKINRVIFINLMKIKKQFIIKYFMIKLLCIIMKGRIYYNNLIKVNISY